VKLVRHWEKNVTFVDADIELELLIELDTLLTVVPPVSCVVVFGRIVWLEIDAVTDEPEKLSLAELLMPELVTDDADAVLYHVHMARLG
jgi:hypothetical protein